MSIERLKLFLVLLLFFPPMIGRGFDLCDFTHFLFPHKIKLRADVATLVREAERLHRRTSRSSDHQLSAFYFSEKDLLSYPEIRKIMQVASHGLREKIVKDWIDSLKEEMGPNIPIDALAELLTYLPDHFEKELILLETAKERRTAWEANPPEEVARAASDLIKLRIVSKVQENKVLIVNSVPKKSPLELEVMAQLATLVGSDVHVSELGVRLVGLTAHWSDEAVTYFMDSLDELHRAEVVRSWIMNAVVFQHKISPSSLAAAFRRLEKTPPGEILDILGDLFIEYGPVWGIEDLKVFVQNSQIGDNNRDYVIGRWFSKIPRPINRNMTADDLIRMAGLYRDEAKHDRCLEEWVDTRIPADYSYRRRIIPLIRNAELRERLRQKLLVSQ